jgi:competence protein ComEC
MRRPPLQAPPLWQCYLAFWILGILGAVWFNPALLCAFFLPVADSRLRRPCRAAFAAVIFGTGLLIAGRQLAAVVLPPTLSAKIEQSRQSRLCGIVRDVQPLPDNRLRVFLEQVRFQSGPEAEPESVPGLAAWTWENPFLNPLAGQSVCFDRRPRPVHSLANDGPTDSEIWWRSHGVSLQAWTRGEQVEPRFSGQGNFMAVLRENLRGKFLTALRPADSADGGPGQKVFDMPQGRAVLAALLFGDRRFIRLQTMNAFAAATLAHSLALSGQHLAVAGLAGWLCIMAAAGIHARLYLRKPRLVWVALATWPPALAYLWLGGAPPSLMRAACMLFVLGIWLARQKVFTSLDVVCAAVLCLTVLDPLIVFDTGMQLSVLCVCIIGLALPFLRTVIPRPDALRERAGQSPFVAPTRCSLRILLLSLMLQAALLPLNLLLFSNAGFWFPLNVLWLPLLGFFVLPAAFLGFSLQLAGLEQAARLVLDCAALPPQGLADMLHWLNLQGLLDTPALLRPHWTALPAFAALACAAALAVGRKKPLKAGRRLFAIGCILLLFGPLLRIQERAAGEIRLNLLDVGQGQSLVLNLPEGLRLLLDGGGSASLRFDVGKAVISPVLSYNAAPRLAAVCNSHPDTDHLGGLLHPLATFEVDKIFDNGQPANGNLRQKWEEFGGRRHSLSAGDSLILGSADQGLRLEVLWPPSLSPDEVRNGRETRGNDASLVLRLTRFGQGLALVPGDCGAEALAKLLASGRDVRARVLVAPHHGSDSSFNSDFYRAVAPEIVAASCGFQNQFGHPGLKLRTWLEQEGIPLFTTARSGRISLAFPPGEPVRVDTRRNDLCPQ